MYLFWGTYCRFLSKIEEIIFIPFNLKFFKCLLHRILQTLSQKRHKSLRKCYKENFRFNLRGTSFIVIIEGGRGVGRGFYQGTISSPPAPHPSTPTIDGILEGLMGGEGGDRRYKTNRTHSIMKEQNTHERGEGEVRGDKIWNK
jgi:hypothetical protein